jgi:nucleotide-binding universal stress UspA family protein
LNQYGKDLLEKASARAVSGGIKTEILLRELRGGSRVAEAIVKAARDARCELIVIGTHGRRGVRRALLGSDAEDVVRSSPVPVLVVRDAATVS